jgi:hypothetical protein
MSAIDAIREAQERLKRGETNLSKEDKEFNRLRDEYFERFGKDYGILFFSSEARMPISWHNERIREALRTGVPIDDPEPEIPPGILI